MKDKEQRTAEWLKMTPRQREASKKEKIARDLADPNFNSALVDRAQKRMMRVDQMPPELRKVVYEYNLEVVQEFLNHGVKKASSIKHLIDTVLCADRKDGTPRFKLNKSPNAKRNSVSEEEEYWHG
jgi:hypothetical protein